MSARATSRGVGQYVAGEAHLLLWRRLYKFGAADRRPVIYFPGGTGSELSFIVDPVQGSHVAKALADAGFPLVSAAFGGALTFGNDVSQTRIGQVRTFINATLGALADKALLVAVSQGVTSALNWARANPSLTAAIVGLVPGVNLADLHDNDRGGWAAAIETAYGGAGGYAAAVAAHDPAQNAATHASQGIPIQLHYSSTDGSVPPEVVTAFALAAGAEAISSGDNGHSASSVDEGTVVAFLEEHAA